MSYRRARLRRLVVATVSSLLVITATLQPALAAKPPTVAASGPSRAVATASPATERDPATVDGPSIQYEEAQAHAGDVIDFEAGERVTVGFTPRPDDTWPVGGVSPRALPAGTASGFEIRADGLAGVDSATNEVAVDADPASLTADPEVAALTASNSNLRREVFGFLPYWELPDSTTTLDYRVLSTVAYFGVGADKYGNLMKTTSTGAPTTGWGGWTSSKMTSVINAAHAAGTRVVLTIQCFAWTSSQKTTQATLLGSSTARTRLAQQIVAAVVARGVDGVNLDFEPIVTGYSDEFTSFVRQLRSRLNAAHAGYQLTFDTTGHIGNYPIEAATAPGGADAVLIMGYDYRGAGASSTGSIDPLTGPVYDLTDTVAAYTARIAPSKVILGVPYYGRAWSTPDDKPHSKNISGTKYGSSAAVFYADAMNYLDTHGRRWDAIEQAPWTAYRKQVCSTAYGCLTTWRELYVDDAASLKLRYDLINRTNIRGAGIWALGYDETRPELYKALADKFLNDTTAPVTGISILPQTVRDEGFVVSWATWDDSSVSSWDVQVATDGGAWTDWRVNTTQTSDVYLGKHANSYAFRVRATDSHGNDGAWTVTYGGPGANPLQVGGFGNVLIDGLAMRASYSTASLKLGELAAGDALRIIGGPVSNEGYTWWQVTGPVDEWAPVGAVQVGFWVAATGGSSPYVEPRRPVYATRVDAVLRDYTVAPGLASRTVAPNDPLRNDVLLTWTNGAVLSDLHLNVVRADGTLAGTIPFTALGAGPQQYRWTGKINGTLLPEGAYILQLEGTAAGQAVHAPSARPATSGQVATFGVSIDLKQGMTLVSIAPTRVLDTAKNLGISGPFLANAARKLVVAGKAGIPVNAIAVTGTLRVLYPTKAGYVSLTQTPTNNPATASIHFGLNQIVATGVTIGLASDGSIGVVYKAPSGASARVVFEVSGYYLPTTAGSSFVSIAPTRVLDTAKNLGISGPFLANAARKLVVAGKAGIPVNAIAVTGTLRVLYPTKAGYVSLTQTPTNNPATASIHFGLNQIVATGVTIGLASDGSIGVVYKAPSGANARVVFEVSGYYLPTTAGSSFVSIAPTRVLDTAKNLGISGPFLANAARKLVVAGKAGIPVNAIAVTGTLRVLYPTKAGYVSLTQTPTNNPATASIHFGLNQIVATGVTIGLASDGSIGVVYKAPSGANARVVFEVSGYYR